MARGTIIPRELKDGTKKYDAVIRLNGKQVWKSFSRKKAAEEYLDSHSTEVRDGTFREIRKATFREYAEHWRATHAIAANLKPSTLGTYLALFDRHILPEFEHYQMQAISSAEINSFRARLQKRGLSAKSVRNILSLLGRVFLHAIGDRYLRHSPMVGVDKPKLSKKRKGRALHPAEIQALLAAAGDPETRLLSLAAVLSGMRRGELFGLYWEDVDWRANVIHVRRSLYWLYGKHVKPAEGDCLFVLQPPKSQTSIREIDLSPVLKRELQARYLTSTKTGLIFHAADGKPRDPNEFGKRQFARAVAAAGLGKLRFHDLRHTFGSLKIEQGENVYYIQRQMGHASISVTIDVYGHLLESRKPAAAAKTDALLFPVAEPEAAESTAVN